jgi:amino acid transporter
MTVEKRSFKQSNLSMWYLFAFSAALMAPIVMAIGNAGAAVVYAGFAAPLIPIIGAVLVLFVSVPILEYARYTKFSGGYYGLAELGFGKAVGKFVALLNYLYYFIIYVAIATALPFGVITTIYYVTGYLMPEWTFLLMAVIILIWGYLQTVFNVKIAAKVVLLAVVTQIVVLLIYSLYVISKTPYNSTAAFNPANSIGGFHGLFLGAILAGFLFYLGYGTSLFFSEEGKAPFKTVWKSIVIAILVTGGIGILAIYSEVAGIGLANSASLASDLNPGAVIYGKYMGPVAVYILLAVFVFAQLGTETSATMAGARLAFSLSRDDFFSGKFGKFNGRLHPKYDTPANAATVIFIGSLVITFVEAGVIFHYFGYYNGVFDSYFLAGSMAVAIWFIHHIIPDLGMIRALPKYFKQKLSRPRNIFVALIAPLTGTAILIYSFYEGYSSLTEPYFGGFITVLVLVFLSIVFVSVKARKGTLGHSFIEESIIEQYKLSNVEERVTEGRE